MLLEQVVAVEERTLAEEHPNRLASQYEVALAYRSDGISADHPNRTRDGKSCNFESIWATGA